MCGIIGIFGSEANKEFDLKVLSHRGPDGSNVWKSSEHESPVILGHTRLSVLDTSASGSQPMISDDGRYVLVFNGEIYNFIELRSEMKKRSEVFRSDSDSEVLLKGLITEGPSFLLKCNGMWAFCLWDRKEQTALFGRDRFGEKPLYYASIGNSSFIFCSEMKGIYKYLSKVKPVDNIKLFLENIFDYESTDYCVVEGIKRFLPGSYAYLKNRRLTISRWWNTLDHLPLPPNNYEDQVSIWRDIFLDAVKIRMRSDVPIGTALSGGLDSSAVFSAMAHLAEGGKLTDRASINWANAYCAHFPGSSLDELSWAEKVTDSFGLSLNKVKIDPETCGWDLLQALFSVEDPYMTLPFPMLATYKGISNSGVKVTLDGHGCDELFSGYGHLNAAYETATPSQLAELKAIQNSIYSGEYRESNNPKTQHVIEKLKTKSRPIRMFLKNKILQRSAGRFLNWPDNSFRNDDLLNESFRRFDPLTKELYILYHHSVLPTLLRNYDRYSMASGVEIRMPFTDYRLVTFTFSLPWTSKVGGGYTKRILRDSLKGIIPDEVRLRRSKIGWNAPLHEWLKGFLSREIEILLDDSQAAVCAKNALKKFKNIASPTFNDGQKLWKILLPYLWSCSLTRCERPH